ncbi:hypothetical protein ACJ6WD_35315 [Streptomyces sp. VTCC 41912]|uniref:hypothetical protein n=1 Tax=Streptomyces sp. VTCC 41912 TaxID=3383243 RepID=UPI003896A23F
MTLLDSYRAHRAVKRFRRHYGPIERWPADAYVVYQDLVAVAGRITPWQLLLRLRCQALARIACVMPLYGVAECVGAARGRYWDRLERVIDRLDDRAAEAEERCVHAGDEPWVVSVGRVTDRMTNVVCRVANRLARG